MTGSVLPLRLQVGARTVASIRRRLVRVALSLDDVLAARLPALPALGGADGYLVTSLPAPLAGAVATGGMLVHVRQRYVRHWTDLTIGHAGWEARLSANARQSLRRKAKRLAAAGRITIRGYRTVDELARFHARARPLAAVTYQERLLGAGLPDTPAFHAAMRTAAAADAARGWLLAVDGVPVAYLYGSAQGSALRYDYVGHDPAWNALSPGSVLHAHAFAELFAEKRFAAFDFTEGEGQHKRQLATGGVPCADLLLLRPTLANRATLALLGGWDAGLGLAGRAARTPAMRRIARGIRR